jgi:hypothetical protein
MLGPSRGALTVYGVFTPLRCCFSNIDFESRWSNNLAFIHRQRQIAPLPLISGHSAYARLFLVHLRRLGLPL